MSVLPSLHPTDADADAEALRRERDALRDELTMLKAQRSPHFLFNTLNNLYGSALTERSLLTAERIEQPSGVIRSAVSGLRPVCEPPARAALARRLPAPATHPTAGRRNRRCIFGIFEN